MSHAPQGYGAERRDLRPLEPATSAFLYLGEKLRGRRTRGDEKSTKTAQIPVESAKTLFQLVEVEIIPRLMLAHKARKSSEHRASEPDVAVSAEEHERFLTLVLSDTSTATRRFVDELLQRGISHDALFLDLLPRAAQRMGELWDEDQCDFSDVTLGLCRLHEVVREHSVVHDGVSAQVSGNAPRVLLATACADQHVLGVVLVAEFFRRAGWRVWSEPGAFRSQLAAILSEESFDVLGLSAACNVSPDDLSNEIEIFRKASVNRSLRILIGGRLVLERPELIARVGADGGAGDASAAPVTAKELLMRPGKRGT
jgi:methanogenic corrinoid protein MtbC1